MTAAEPMVNISVLFGHRAFREMPLIFAGRLFGFLYEHTEYDRDGKVVDRYYTAPCAWMTVS